MVPEKDKKSVNARRTSYFRVSLTYYYIPNAIQPISIQKQRAISTELPSVFECVRNDVEKKLLDFLGLSRKRDILEPG